MGEHPPAGGDLTTPGKGSSRDAVMSCAAAYPVKKSVRG